MTLGELLSELRENILHDRSDRVSGQSDRLWSDDTLVRYINEAQRRFARKTLCIRDGTTPEVTRVTLVAGQSVYVLDQSILAIYSCKMVGDQYDMTRGGHTALDLNRPVDTYYWDPSTAPTTADGKPIVWTTDEYVTEDDRDSFGTMNLRVWPTPSTDYNGSVLALRVARLPLNPFKTSRTSQVPEIPEDHHLEMLDWAAYLALRIADHDAGDPKRADEFRLSFEQKVLEARNELNRKTFAPTMWGFGRNAFSWEK